MNELKIISPTPFCVRMDVMDYIARDIISMAEEMLARPDIIGDRANNATYIKSSTEALLEDGSGIFIDVPVERIEKRDDAGYLMIADEDSVVGLLDQDEPIVKYWNRMKDLRREIDERF